jgi:hypothetical protein
VAAYIVIMQKKPNLRSLSDEELLRRLSEILKDSRRVEADLVAHIAEVDARRAYAREAVPSMFKYCTELLHLSEPEAWLRIRAARASRKHPRLLTMLRSGRIHLSGIALLAPHLNSRNEERLLDRATHKSKRQIEEMVAELKPQPDAPPMVRKLPAPRPKASGAPAPQLRPDAVPTTLQAASASGILAPALQLRPDAVGGGPASASKIEPVAPDRYRVRFTASGEMRDKLERLKDLMRSSVPDGDLARIIDIAITEKLERLEAKRFGKTRAPRKTLAETDTMAKSRHIPAAVRRAVYERDQGRCTYEDARGKRCTARDQLEFHHHDVPYGKKGDHSLKNVRITCESHNKLLAELEYGEAKMARYRRSGNRVSEPAAPYSVDLRPIRSRTQGVDVSPP